MSKSFTAADVASHNKPDNLYIIVDEDVYDLTTFQDEHPGMPLILSPYALYDHTDNGSP
jgi:cytochrome b involved in lipid metabolism